MREIGIQWLCRQEGWLLISIQVAQNAVLLAVATGAGLFLAYRIGLGAPILERLLDREPVGDRLKAILLPSIVLGIVASLVVIGLDALVFGPALKALGNWNLVVFFAQRR